MPCQQKIYNPAGISELLFDLPASCFLLLIARLPGIAAEKSEMFSGFLSGNQHSCLILFFTIDEPTEFFHFPHFRNIKDPKIHFITIFFNQFFRDPATCRINQCHDKQENNHGDIFRRIPDYFQRRQRQYNQQADYKSDHRRVEFEIFCPIISSSALFADGNRKRNQAAHIFALQFAQPKNHSFFIRRFGMCHINHCIGSFGIPRPFFTEQTGV